MNTHAEYRRHSYRPPEQPAAAGHRSSDQRARSPPRSVTLADEPAPTQAAKGIAWVRPTELATYAAPDGRARHRPPCRTDPARTPYSGHDHARTPARHPPTRPHRRRGEPHGGTLAVSHSFETAEGPARLLVRLRVSGPHAWEQDPEAHDLMLYAARKYEALAIKHRCDPSAGAAAAFEAMRTYAVRTADDPWAVVTMAVKVTLIAEERADGLLCSVDQARRRRSPGTTTYAGSATPRPTCPTSSPRSQSSRSTRTRRRRPARTKRSTRRSTLHRARLAAGHGDLRARLHLRPPGRDPAPARRPTQLCGETTRPGSPRHRPGGVVDGAAHRAGQSEPRRGCTSDGHGVLLRTAHRAPGRRTPGRRPAGLRDQRDRSAPEGSEVHV